MLTLATNVHDDNIIFYICVTVIIVVGMMCATALVMSGHFKLEFSKKDDDDNKKKVSVKPPSVDEYDDIDGPY